MRQVEVFGLNQDRHAAPVASDLAREVSKAVGDCSTLIAQLADVDLGAGIDEHPLRCDVRAKSGRPGFLPR
jgi:hypothetical protein